MYHFRMSLQNDEEPGILNQIKAQICEILTLCAFKYDDDFEKYLPNFVDAVWKLLLSTSQLMQDDSVRLSAACHSSQKLIIVSDSRSHLTPLNF